MNTETQSIQDQVYYAIQHKIKTLCAHEYRMAPKRKNGTTKTPITYSEDVYHLVELSKLVLDASPKEAEEIMAEVTSGSIQYAYFKAIA